MSARTRWSLQSRLKSKYCGTTHGSGPGLVKKLGLLESMPPPNDMAFFVDIYGTLVEDRPPRPSTVDEIRVIPWVPGAIDALRRFESIGYQPHVILNDEKVHGQFVDLFTLSDMHLALYYRAKALGARLTSFKTCQHEAHEGCVCRAPRPGLLQQIAKRYMLNLSNCIVVSKDPAVVQSGFVAGCRSYLLDTWDTLDLDHPVTAMEAIE